MSVKEWNVAPEVICTCGKIVFEVDLNYCSSCGDVMCKDCYTDCFTCGKMYCCNCSNSSTECIRCGLGRKLKQVDEKAFMVIEGVATPIKNSAFMISKTSVTNARDITLELLGKKYRYSFRSVVQNEKDRERFDYFIYFEEVDEIAEKVREIFDEYEEYDDYGIIGWGL